MSRPAAVEERFQGPKFAEHVPTGNAKPAGPFSFLKERFRPPLNQRGYGANPAAQLSRGPHFDWQGVV